MDTNRIPSTLQSRLGAEATAGLVDLFNDARQEWTSEVTGIVGDRFARRLVEETSKLRVEMVQGFAAVRQELGEVRQELRQDIAAVRLEIGALRQEMALNRVELLKWTFLFWVGQFFVVASLIAVLTRVLRP